MKVPTYLQRYPRLICHLHAMPISSGGVCLWVFQVFSLLPHIPPNPNPTTTGWGVGGHQLIREIPSQGNGNWGDPPQTPQPPPPGWWRLPWKPPPRAESLFRCWGGQDKKKGKYSIWVSQPLCKYTQTGGLSPACKCVASRVVPPTHANTPLPSRPWPPLASLHALFFYFPSPQSSGTPPPLLDVIPTEHLITLAN